ncbi:MAG: RagB/SusD family nutrient uptake outer membrane protein [Cyclobacteriaceae bacterium]|nr:RagB/SusD family nutrient uptake outer membrane protein [Cyclobacteriaceae bacterium]
MKTFIKNLALSTAFLVLIFACDGRLDVEPQQSISDDTALGTSDDVQAALVGAYDELGNADIWGGDFLMHADLYADNGELFWNGSFIGPRQIFNKVILTDNGEVAEIWLEAYETINRANNVLSALDAVDADERNRVEGEAKFVRAVTHFYLVLFFGKDYGDGDPNSNSGVPLVLEPTRAIDASSQVSRASVGAVYAQVLADLQDAESLLPTSNGFFATTYSASAMLSRVYMQQRNYAAAANAANTVIASGAFTLTPTFIAAFNNATNTSEDVFAIQVTSSDGSNGLNTFYAPAENGGRGDIDITDTHLLLYEVGDDRLNQFYFDQAGSRRTGKYVNGIDANVTNIRLAEMYLTRCEANIRAGSTVGDTPLNDINVIRARVGLPALVAVTEADALAERKLELAFEGASLWDVKRTEGNVGSLPWNANELVFPIPQREIDANPSLTQNPGY